MKARLLRHLWLVGICCAWKAVAQGDVPKAGGEEEAAESKEASVGNPGGAGASTLSSCAPGAARALFKWQQVPKDGAGGGKGEDAGAGGGASRMELTVDEDALHALSQIDTKLAVVSIAGPYRSGKSYFLNYFANQVLARGFDPQKDPGAFDFKRAFETSSTLNSDGGSGGGGEAGDVFFQLLPACAKPLPGQENTALLLLDTPGLMAPSRSAVQEAQVLALLETVSSVVLYNTQAVVSRSDVESLLMAIDAAAALDMLLLLPEEGDAPAAASEKQPINRPSLVWLLQRSTLKMVNGKGEAQSTDAYLDAALGDVGGRTVRSEFDSFFVTRGAASLPFPMDDLARLQDLDTVPYQDLSHAYQEGMKTAVDLILPASAAKEIGGQAMDGPAFAAFLRKLTQVMNVPVADGDDRLTAFLDGLEAKAMKAATAAYKAEWERERKDGDAQELAPMTAHDLNAKHNKCSLAAKLAANPRSVRGEMVGGHEGDAAVSKPSYPRRPGFDDELDGFLDKAYKEYCLATAQLLSEAEVLGATNDLDNLLSTNEPGSKQSGESERTLAPLPLAPPDYSQVTSVFEDRTKRWEEEIFPEIARSHQDLAKDEVKMMLTERHADALVVKVDAFLSRSLVTVTQQAQDMFDEQLDDLKAQLEALPKPALFEEVKILSNKLVDAAEKASSRVTMAVGEKKAKKVIADEGWEIKARATGEEWKDNAIKALGDGGGGGDASGDASGNGKGNAAAAGDGGGGEDKGADKAGPQEDGGIGRGTADEKETLDLAERILSQHLAPCIAKVDLKSPHGEQAVSNCRKTAEEELEKALGESTASRLPEKQEQALLNAALGKRELEYLVRVVENILGTFTTRFRENLSKLESPVDEKRIDQLYKQLQQQLLAEYPRQDGFLMKRKELHENVERILKLEAEEVRSKNNTAWIKTCVAAADEYAIQLGKATSLFSLGPLRYSGAPPFEPARCLVSGGAVQKVRNKTDKAQKMYQRGTWGRCWLVWLALRLSFVLTVMAGTLLAAGRRLQHRPVATAFIAAAGFHIVVLCLSVSEGLARGTRPWLLASSLVLSYVASGSAVGGKRGRRPSRAIWSSAGRRAVSSNRGSLMPLFRSAGVGEEGSGNGGGSGTGARSWAPERHKE